MYNRHLDTFITAADCGSFLKASEKLYISANAVTKQINLHENELGVKLFERSTQGLALTDAGRLIYTEAKKLIRHSNNILQKAKELEKERKAVIHIGVSLMNPASILLEQWQRAAQQHPNIRLEVVPYEDTPAAFSAVLDKLGQKIDLISCPYQTNYWGDRYNSFHLHDLPLCVTCAKTHPLAAKPLVTLDDLHGETLIMKRPSEGEALFALHTELVQNHPQIKLREVEYLETATFNALVSSREVLLSASCWANVHPLLATVPLDVSYTLPYGIIYAKEPSKEVMEFIVAVGQVEAGGQ